MKFPRWEPGRQGTGYRKLKLLEGSFFDLHLIDYPPGISIPEHVDQVVGKRHLRINVPLLTGGARLSAASTLLRVGERLIVFWSDRYHSVTRCRTRRFVISGGIAI